MWHVYLVLVLFMSSLAAIAKEEKVPQPRKPSSLNMTCSHEAELSSTRIKGPGDLIDLWVPRIRQSSQRVRAFEDFRACFFAYRDGVDAQRIQLNPNNDQSQILLESYFVHLFPEGSGGMSFTEANFDPRQCDEYRRRLVTDLSRAQGCSQNPQTKALTLRGPRRETSSIARLDEILRLLCEGQLNQNPCERE